MTTQSEPHHETTAGGGSGSKRKERDDRQCLDEESAGGGLKLEITSEALGLLANGRCSKCSLQIAGVWS